MIVLKSCDHVVELTDASPCHKGHTNLAISARLSRRWGFLCQILVRLTSAKDCILLFNWRLHFHLKLPYKEILSKILLHHRLDQHMPISHRIKSCFILLPIHIEILKILEEPRRIYHFLEWILVLQALSLILV